MWLECLGMLIGVVSVLNASRRDVTVDIATLNRTFQSDIRAVSGGRLQKLLMQVTETHLTDIRLHDDLSNAVRRDVPRPTSRRRHRNEGRNGLSNFALFSFIMKHSSRLTLHGHMSEQKSLAFRSIAYSYYATANSHNNYIYRDGTGSGFLTRDPTRPDPVTVSFYDLVEPK